LLGLAAVVIVLTVVIVGFVTLSGSDDEQSSGQSTLPATAATGSAATGSAAATPARPDDEPEVLASSTPIPTTIAGAGGLCPARAGEYAGYDVPGSPLNAAALRAVTEQENICLAPLAFDPPCPELSGEGKVYFAAGPDTDSGAAFVLWVYEDNAARDADWRTQPGEQPAPRIACELPGGASYWNQNLVMHFRGYPLDVTNRYNEAGDETPDQRQARDVVVEAFLGLTP